MSSFELNIEKYGAIDSAKFRSQEKTFVVKYGGAAMVSTELRESFAQEIVFLARIGIRVVIVHGGGKEITALADRLGLATTFFEGQRYTDAAMMDVVQMVMAGKTNQDIVARINCYNGTAVGVSGVDAGLLRVKKAAGETDMGFVGQIEEVRTNFLQILLKSGIIPVIAPVGCDQQGQVYNINADVAAAQVASALQADKLFFLSDVDGVYTSGGIRIDCLDEIMAEAMIASGEINNGMIPKMRSAFSSLRGGVGSVYLIDGRVKQSLLREIFSPTPFGSRLVSRAGAMEHEAGK